MDDYYLIMSLCKHSIDEIPVEQTKYLSSKSPICKNTVYESKSYLYQSQVKRLKGLPRKSSSKYLKFTSSNSICTGTRESASDNRKKPKDLRSAHNSNPYMQFNESITTKKKQLIMRDTNIHNFASKLEKKLLLLQKFDNFEVAEEYFEVLDEIIERDLLFGSFLKKIRNGLRMWYERNREMTEYCRSLETKLVEKQSIINQYLITNRHDFSIFNELEENNEKAQTCKIESQKYVFVPLVNWEDAKKKLEVFDTQVNCLKKELSDQIVFQQRIKELEKDQIEFREKEMKFNLLLKALHDRGYPVNEIYEKDVLISNPNTKTQDLPSSYSTLKNYHLLSSDSSISSSREYL